MTTVETTNGTDEPYTLRNALHDACELLKEEFGEADPQAAVALANSLYANRARAEFMAREEHPEGVSYGK